MVGGGEGGFRAERVQLVCGRVYKNDRTVFSTWKFETIVRGPVFNSVYKLLKLSLDCSHILRMIADSEVVNIQGIISFAIKTFYNAVYFYIKQSNRKNSSLRDTLFLIIKAGTYSTYR